MFKVHCLKVLYHFRFAIFHIIVKEIFILEIFTYHILGQNVVFIPECHISAVKDDITLNFEGLFNETCIRIKSKYYPSYF